MTMHGKTISKVNWRLIKTALEKCNRSPQLTQSVGCEMNQITLNSIPLKTKKEQKDLIMSIKDC